MERYKNLSGNSGVTAYELGPNYIKVQFVDGAIYLYTASSAGSRQVTHMKALARRGRGLSAFISTTVRDAYARKEPHPNHQPCMPGPFLAVYTMTLSSEISAQAPRSITRTWASQDDPNRCKSYPTETFFQESTRSYSVWP